MAVCVCVCASSATTCARLRRAVENEGQMLLASSIVPREPPLLLMSLTLLLLLLHILLRGSLSISFLLPSSVLCIFVAANCMRSSLESHTTQQEEGERGISFGLRGRKPRNETRTTPTPLSTTASRRPAQQRRQNVTKTIKSGGRRRSTERERERN